MGPMPVLYIHPWMDEHSHSWDLGQDSSCTIAYQYPESPGYGFYVQAYAAGMYYVGPIKFHEDGSFVRSGTAEGFTSSDRVTEFVEKLYLKNQAMEKVHDIEALLVAPF